jgi:tetratricopeptide (TPR) repeat protein
VILGLLITRSFWHVGDGSGERQYTEENLEQETMAVLNRLVKDFPDSADPLGLMGDVYVEMGKTAEAMKCWEKCAELQPHLASSYERMAHTAVEREEFEKAVAIAHKALKIDPVMPGIHSQLGRALRGLAKPTESLAALEKAVRISPKSAVNHHLLGQAYQQLQQYEQAKQSYMTALHINPNYTETCYGIVSASERLGQKDEAAKYRKKFKEMKARDWQTLPDKRDYVLNQRFLVESRRRVSKTHTNAGILYYERGRRQTAEKHWLRAAELDPANMGCREELMTLYQQNGRNEEALQICAQLRQFAPENPQYHMCAGKLLTRMNRIEDAMLAVKQAIELEPNNATFRRIYDQIQKRR